MPRMDAPLGPGWMKAAAFTGLSDAKLRRLHAAGKLRSALDESGRQVPNVHDLRVLRDQTARALDKAARLAALAVDPLPTIQPLRPAVPVESSGSPEGLVAGWDEALRISGLSSVATLRRRGIRMLRSSTTNELFFVRADLERVRFEAAQARQTLSAGYPELVERTMKLAQKLGATVEIRTTIRIMPGLSSPAEGHE